MCAQCYTPDDGRRYCPKHVESYYKNKFEKLVLLVGFIIRMYLNYKYIVIPSTSYKEKSEKDERSGTFYRASLWLNSEFKTATNLSCSSL